MNSADMANEIVDEMVEEIAEEVVEELADEIADDIVDELVDEMLDQNQDPFDEQLTDDDIDSFNYLPAAYKGMAPAQQQPHPAYNPFMDQLGEFSTDDLEEDWTEEEDSEDDDMSELIGMEEKSF